MVWKRSPLLISAWGQQHQGLTRRLRGTKRRTIRLVLLHQLWSLFLNCLYCESDKVKRGAMLNWQSPLLRDPGNNLPLKCHRKILWHGWIMVNLTVACLAHVLYHCCRSITNACWGTGSIPSPHAQVSSQFPQYNRMSKKTLSWDSSWWHLTIPQEHNYRQECRLTEAWSLN